ncbi:cytochrome P450 78A5-like [Cucurbita moschata]|uniref:Cytochrome P450 78A5-like n=1 Tax=Cucurbita moschata TaxID=3662 RepID=A0A6J1E791_CUCMO|nr:cytochrome P450 78A5-like [Cucurbita moschata]
MSLEHEFLFVPASGFASTMANNVNLFLCFLLFVAVFGLCLSPGGLAWALVSRPRNKPIIPGPCGTPFLGQVFTFTTSLTHRVLANLAHTLKAKSLMSFSVGFTRFVISSNPITAKELLNSSAFADRPIKESAYELLFHRAMGFAPYGEYWRNLRRISATHLFSPKRISNFGELRQRIGVEMVEEIKGLMEKNGEIEVRKVLHFGSLNNVMGSVFGKRYEFFGDGGSNCEVEGLVSEGYDLLGSFNWSDHFPVLGWLDLQGVRKRCKILVGKVNVFVGKIIEDHRMNRKGKGVVVHNDNDDEDDDTKSGDFVDVLLDLEKENKLTDSDMIAVLWEMIFRGTDTVAILLEWILARMVLHPDIQSKLQSEIDRVVIPGRNVSDSDLPNLPYLHAVVKETLRMHPPGPLLSWARLAIHDTHVGGHFIPAGTTAMVNMWAITHDQHIWSDPTTYDPERFLKEEVAIMGSDLRLAPFGSGRRVCPGKAMGLATVELWLAQLVHRFKWVQVNGGCGNGVDLSECLKLSLEMKQPLICRAVPRF